MNFDCGRNGEPAARGVDEATVPGAAYVRMSTENRHYSPDIQLEVIRSYAQAKRFDISPLFVDGTDGNAVCGLALTGLMPAKRSTI
ncbi:hypothetical protein IE4872_PD02045 (plasmid) [Rhizobium gallicum]|uniref:Uncharacterized protein n=1 Tax=Rhizobium gallicum TaxID=56730 RepID=A0A1L5NXG6_9HYPH|nr:recombinase family protein [Rhizobium gallicum]APO72559.1 hypothetical protein IE4872_PD02045 [Rhizobium gallicum]